MKLQALLGLFRPSHFRDVSHKTLGKFSKLLNFTTPFLIVTKHTRKILMRDEMKHVKFQEDWFLCENLGGEAFETSGQ